MQRPAAAFAAAGALLAAGALGGCGGGGGAPSSSSTSARARATTHEAAQVVGTPSARGSKARYGKLPAWLPKAKVPVGRIVTATARRPAFAIQGDTVHVELPSGSADVTTVGPSVPAHGTPPPEITAARFVMTVSHVHGTIPLRRRMFTFRDEQGHIHRPRSVRRLAGGRPLPPRLTAGAAPVSLVVDAVLPSGNGALRWAPLGARPTVSWDFVVEID